MLGSFIFLIFLNIVIKWTLRQIRNQKQRKLNPELYEMARNWDGRPETLLNCDLSPDLLKVLETYQKVIFGPEVNFKLPTAGDSEKDLEKIEVAKPPQQPTDQSKAPRVQLNVNRVESVQQSPVLVVNKPQVELPVTRKLLSLACSQGDVEINLIAPTPAQTPSAAVRNFTTTMLPRTLPVTNLGSIPPYISDRLLMIEDDNASPIESHSDIFTTAAVHNYASKSIKPSLLQPDDHHRGLMRTQSVCVRLPFYPSSDSQLSQKSNCRQLVNGGNSFLHPNRLLESRSNRRFGSSSSAPAQCLETDL